MPEGQNVSFRVCTIDGQQLPEYRIKNTVYTEVDLHGPNSYTVEEDGQTYPVMPFTIALTRNCQDTVWVTVFLDGQIVSSRPLHQRKLSCNSVKVGNDLRELLFTLPRIVEDQEKKDPLGEKAGTIMVRVNQVRSTGQRQMPIFISQAPGQVTNQQNKLHHLTKKDVQQRAEGHMAGTIVSREGRPTVSLVKSNRYRLANHFSYTSQVLEELVLHYRPLISSYCPPPPSMSTPLHEECDRGDNLRQSRPPFRDATNLPVEQSVDKSEVGNVVMSPLPKERCSEIIPLAKIKHRESSAFNTYANMSQSLFQANVNQDGSNAISAPSDDKDGNTVLPDSTADHTTDLMGSTDHTTDLKGLSTSAHHGTEMENQTGLIPPTTIKHRDSLASAMIPSEEIKRRESSMIGAQQNNYQESGMIPLDQIKRRESCMVPLDQNKSQESGMIPLDQIKRRESGMIPLDQIKRRESGMIPLDQIKRRESGMIPLDQIKRRESGRIPLDKIKRRESCLLMFPPGKESLSGNSPSPKDFVVIDSDDEMDDIYLYDENNDSIIYMGDDDCCILDLTNNISMVELEDSMDNGP